MSAEFTSGVYITHEYTPSDVNQDPAAMLATLTANTNGQTTYEVQKGDTFMQIAFDNDMSMSELEALNPDVDINRIYIGQLLNVKEEIPFLSVKTVDNVTYTESIECPVVEVQDDSMYQASPRCWMQASPASRSSTRTSLTSTAWSRSARCSLPSHPGGHQQGHRCGHQGAPLLAAQRLLIWPVYGRITSYFGYRSIFGSYSLPRRH